MFFHFSATINDAMGESPEAACARALDLARAHPTAATHYRSAAQTPRVFHTHPDIRAAPWWDPSDFSLTAALKKAFNGGGGVPVQQELDALISLQEGALRAVRTSDVEQLRRETEVEVGTSGEDGGSVSPEGLKRVFTPHIGVRAERAEVEEQGAGAWAEFGPLFNGIEWDEEKCAVVPSLCAAIREDPAALAEQCGVSPQEARERGAVSTPAEVESRCGSDTLVTVLRLRPGGHILPHCGNTNKRLIMHFALRGADGVEFRVGDHFDEPGNGMKVFNTNASAADRPSGLDPALDFTVTVDPRYQPLSLATPVKKTKGWFKRRGSGSDEGLLRSGWVYSYQPSPLRTESGEGGLAGDQRGGGRAIVFDDSFEHEVVHRGTEDRFVLLVVLRHPDVQY